MQESPRRAFYHLEDMAMVSLSSGNVKALHAPNTKAQNSSSSLSAQPTAERKSSYSVTLETLKNCKLGVAWYPDFVYNAHGGGATTAATKNSEKGSLEVKFDPSSIFIPPLDYSTTTFLGLPLPPPLKIDIKPRVLEGVVYEHSGLVEFKFVAEFLFTAGPLYKAPGLLVDTYLTTESCQGQQRSGKGYRLKDNGECKLVGTAVINKVDDAFLNTFLGLPSECLAEMLAKITVNKHE